MKKLNYYTFSVLILINLLLTINTNKFSKKKIILPNSKSNLNSNSQDHIILTSTLNSEKSNIKRTNGNNESHIEAREDSLSEKAPSAFEGLVNKLKETVVMIDINSDMQFFDEKSTTSKATGFIVNKELGLIATNKHVTRISPTTHKINFLNGAVEKGTVVYYDFYHDFGFIQLDIAKDKSKYKASELYKSLVEVELGSSYDLKTNDEIMLIGNNEGVNYSIKYGIVNNINIADFNGVGSIILTNFDRTGGSSGSPVWNTKGKVVAIHAMGNSEGSFEVPIDYLKEVLESFEKKKKDGEEKDFFGYDKGFIGAFFSLVPQFKIKNLHLSQSSKKKPSIDNLNNNEAEKEEKKEIENFFKNIKNYQREPEEVAELIQINSIIPSYATKNHIKSGDILMKVNGQIIGNDLVLLEKIFNQNIMKKISMKIMRFGKIIDLDDVKIYSTQKEKVFKFLKIANTIIHDVNLYIRLFNPLIPEGIVISKIGLGSPFNDISSEGQFLMSAFNSKNIKSIDEFIEEFKNNKNGNTDNIDVMDLSNSTFKVFNYTIDFGNIQEIYLYEFNVSQGAWNKKIIKIPLKASLANRGEEDNQKILNYEHKHFKYSKINNLRNEYNELFDIL